MTGTMQSAQGSQTNSRPQLARLGTIVGSNKAEGTNALKNQMNIMRTDSNSSAGKSTTGVAR